MITDDIKNLRDECEAMRLELADLKQIIYRLNSQKGHYHAYRYRDSLASTAIFGALDSLGGYIDDKGPEDFDVKMARDFLLEAAGAMWPPIAMAAPVWPADYDGKEVDG